MQQHMDKPDPQTCLGSGKLTELMQRVDETSAGDMICCCLVTDSLQCVAASLF